jgi:flagellar motor protein MotB
VVIAGAVVAVSASCSYVPDAVNPMTWFEDDEPAAQADEAAASDDFPSLGTVPEAPADAPETEEFTAIAEGLNADKENAQYTDAQVRQADDEVGGEPQPATVAQAAPEPEPALPEAEPAVSQAEAPVPAQPLEGSSGAQAATAAVPAQPLGGATVQTVAGAATPTPAVPLPNGTVPEMFAVAFQASGATTLAAAGVPATAPAVATVPAQATTVASAVPAFAMAPTRQVATLYFADGSTRLGRGDDATLLEIAYAYGATGGPIRIVGHASAGSGSSRSKLANLDVSMARAVAVARELGKLGVPQQAMIIEGAADNQPVSAGDPAANRRVEIFLGG